MISKKASDLLKKIAKFLWNNSPPGHWFSPLILFFILFSLTMAGFRVAGWFDMVMHANSPLVEIYFISLGGTIGLKWVKKDGSADK